MQKNRRRMRAEMKTLNYLEVAIGFKIYKVSWQWTITKQTSACSGEILSLDVLIVLLNALRSGESVE